MMMPFQVVMIPDYIAIRNLGLYNTGWSLIIPGIFNPFAVFLMRQYMLSVPDEKLEAAKVDGANNWWIYWRIMLPMVAPGVCAMVVLCFAEVWNMIEQPLLFLSDTTKYPLSLVLRNIDIIPIRLIFSGAVLFTAPVVILFLIFQDNIVSGIKHIKLNN
jgi:multiple sugar transport system permease protein